MEDLLRIETVEKRLNFSRCTIYKAVERGELPCVRIGRSIRFQESAIEAFVKQRERCGKPAPVSA